MKENTRLLLILGFMAFLANGDTYAASVFMGEMAEDLGVSASMATMSVTSYALTFGVFTLLFGPLADRFGKAKIVKIASFSTAIFSIFAAFSYDIYSLMFFRAINGLFGAGILPVCMSLVGDSFEGLERQKAIGNVMGLSFLGAAMATLIGGTIAFFASWRAVYIVYGALELILACVMHKILKPDVPKLKELNIVKVYASVLQNRSILPIIAIIFLVGFSMRGSFSFAGLLVSETTGYNVFIVGLILSVFGLGTVIGSKVAPVLRVKFKNTFLELVATIGFFAFLLLSYSQNTFIICFSLYIFGVVFITMHSSFIAAAQARLPEMKGTTMSLTSFCMFTGTGVGTSVYGVFMDYFSVSSVFICAAVIVLCAGFIANRVILR